MKTTTELFDIVLLLVILGLMLPFLFSAMRPLIDTEAWGFSPTDDKTMKRYSGGVPSTADDSMTATEMVLVTVVHDRQAARYMLPNGAVITVDDDYPAHKEVATIKAQSALDPSGRYCVVYDYENDMWITQQQGSD